MSPLQWGRGGVSVSGEVVVAGDEVGGDVVVAAAGVRVRWVRWVLVRTVRARMGLIGGERGSCRGCCCGVEMACGHRRRGSVPCRCAC